MFLFRHILCVHHYNRKDRKISLPFSPDRPKPQVPHNFPSDNYKVPGRIRYSPHPDLHVLRSRCSSFPPASHQEFPKLSPPRNQKNPAESAPRASDRIPPYDPPRLLHFRSRGASSVPIVPAPGYSSGPLRSFPRFSTGCRFLPYHPHPADPLSPHR